jgi:6-phosphogluconolactonase
MKKNFPSSAFAIAMAITFSAFVNLVPVSAADDGASIVYISESGDNRIAVFSLNEETGDLTRQSQLDLPSPGSLDLRADRTRLYASVRNTKEFASIEVNPMTGDLSTPVMAPAGSNAAYVHVDKSGRWLLAASYSDGVVTVSRIENDGVVMGAPVATMKTGARAHCVRTDAANRFAFVPHVMDLNKVEQIRFDAATGKIESNSPPHVSGAAGAGPRHLDFHPNGRWVYLVNEQGQSVTHGDYDAAKGTITLRDTVSTTPPDWDKSKGSCADIHVSADGKFVYASNRGHDSLAVFSVNAETGALTALGQTPTEKTPRSFALVAGDRFVISAGQGSNKLVVYRRDATSGALTPLKTYDCGKSPAWVLGVRMLGEKF